MKKIGLVGGTGPESTIMYYKELNSRITGMYGTSSFTEFGKLFCSVPGQR